MTRARPALSPPAPPRPWCPTPGFVAIILLAAGALAYHNSFTGPFVFDDAHSIVDNPTILSLGSAWRPPADGGLTVSGRPVLNFSLAVNYALSGTDPWSYHALNLLIHLSGALVLFGLVRRTLLQPRLAVRYGPAATATSGVAAALWLLHPLQTESVTYVIQRAESLVSLWYLLTLYSFVRATAPGASGRLPSRLWAVLCVLCCLLGMATKEVMVSAPLLVAFYDRIFIAGSWRAVWTRRRGFHLALAATWLVLFTLVMATGGRGGTAGFGTAVTPLAYALTQVQVIVHYLRLTVWPSPLVLDYGTVVVDGWTAVIAPALLLIPLAAASLWAGLRAHPAGFCGIFFFAVLAPSSSFVPVATQTMAEHRMYLPLAALTTLAAIVAWRWLGRGGLAGLAAIAIVFGFLTVRRNADYATDIGLGEDTIAKMPGNARARALLAEYYVHAGRLDDGRRELERSLATEPGVPEVLNNLGNVWQRQGNTAEAIACFRQALVASPRAAPILNNLGNALISAGEVDAGLIQLEAALKLAPASLDARFNLANTLAQNGRVPEAAAQLALLIQIHPNDAESRNLYGHTLEILGRETEAIAQLEAAVRLQPENADFHEQYGIALGRAGRFREALAQFEAALRLAPAHPTAGQNAALARQQLGMN